MIDHITRVQTDEQAARDAGLIFHEATIYPIGTQVAASGQETYRVSREHFEQRPLVEDVLSAVPRAVKAQRRRDYLVDLHSLSMQTDGALVSKQIPQPIGYNQHALAQLLGRLESSNGGAGYLMGCPPTLREPHVNHWIRESERIAAATPVPTRGKARSFQANIRTMLTEQGRGAYAVLSTDYKVRDAEACIQSLHQALKSKVGDQTGARGEFLLDGPHWRYRVYFHSDMKLDDLVVGDIFRGALTLESSDDGSGSIRIISEIERARCINLTTISAWRADGLRHNAASFDDRLEVMVGKAVGSISHFAEKWAEASRDLVLDVADNSPQYVFAVLVDKGLVRVPGFDKAQLVERLCTAWRAEGVYTFSRASISNAITRVAHTQPWASPWTVDALEEQGGELLYNRLTLAPQPASFDPDVPFGRLLEVD